MCAMTPEVLSHDLKPPLKVVRVLKRGDDLAWFVVVTVAFDPAFI
jgi:hypothetical protein